MRKTFGLIVLAGLVGALALQPTPAETWHTPEQCSDSDLDNYHTLCNGIMAFFDFEEANDSLRWSTINNVYAWEADGTTAFQDAEHKLGSYSFEPVQSIASMLRLPNFLSGQQWTVAFWFHIDDDASTKSNPQYIMSSRNGLPDPGVKGTLIMIDDKGSTWSLHMTLTDLETGDIMGIGHTGTFNDTSANKFYLASFKLSRFWNGKSVGCISLNGGAYQCTAHSYYIHPGYTYMTLGGEENASYGSDWFFDGLIDGLAFWNRPITDQEISEYYNSGSGQVPPFAK